MPIPTSAVEGPSSLHEQHRLGNGCHPELFLDKENKVPRICGSQEIGFSPQYLHHFPWEASLLLRLQSQWYQPPARCRSCCYMPGAIRTQSKQARCDVSFQRAQGPPV